ncbi:MAG: ferritin-like domain-containing protein [Actinomycetota bacterium]|nr:ferritin-like domain-containing protein [Actinomycetota bacterium]
MTTVEPALAGHARRAVAEEWGRRTRAEYTSAAIAHGVTLGLLQHGAPPDLIRDGLRIVDDELVHSELSAEVSDAAGGAPPTAIPLEDLALPVTDDHLADLVDPVVRYFCVGETVAVPLFTMLRRNASSRDARRALDRIGKDEPRHRQFGWDVLDWLLLVHPGSLEAATRVAAPAMADIRRAHAAGDGHAALDPAARAWGLADTSDYLATIDRCLREDITPRFAAREIAC